MEKAFGLLTYRTAYLQSPLNYMQSNWDKFKSQVRPNGRPKKHPTPESLMISRQYQAQQDELRKQRLEKREKKQRKTVSEQNGFFNFE